MRASRSLLPALAILICLGTPCATRAAQRTDLTSAFDEGNPYDFNVKVGYERSLRRGAIKREGLFRPGFGLPYETGFFKELRFSQVRHLLNVRAEAAIFRDLQLHVEFPIVLQDTRELNFAQNDGDPCAGATGAREDNCVTKYNSSLVADKFLDGSMMSADQVAVAGPNAPPGGLMLPHRSGLDQFHVGLSWAPLNQRRDPTKPTWVLGFEARFAIGAPMEYDRRDPTANTAVGQGVNQYHWFTTVSRRYKYLDPYWTIFYMLPHARASSLLSKTRFPLSGQERSSPQQRGGVEAGMEIIPWEVPEQGHKFSIDLTARLEGVFEGRGYSDMWEVFANSPLLAGPCRPDEKSFNAQFWDNGAYCSSPDQVIPFPGVTSIENHAIFSARLGFNFDLAKYFRGRIGVGLGHEQQHFITFGDAGRSGPRGHIEYNDATQVNPMNRPFIDSVGRRFRVSETTVFDFFVSAMGRF